MLNYQYKARDSAGKSVGGNMQAASEEELYDKLHKLGYLTTEIKESRSDIQSLSNMNIDFLFERFQTIRSDDLTMFYIQLANLIRAGISLPNSLNGLRQQIRSKKLSKILDGVIRNVESGETFSDSLANYPQIFPALFISMVKAGEVTGRMDMVLQRYASYCEEQTELRQKITGALFYPIILLLAGIGVSSFIVAFVVPQFSEIFMKLGIPLPFPTMMLYRVATGLRYFWLSILLVLAVAWLGFQYFTGTPQGKLLVDRLKLKMPLWGDLFRKIAIARFARTLGMFIATGVPILQGLAIVRSVMGNEVLSRVITSAGDTVEKGEKLSDALEVSKEFPIDVIQMIRVGEETGNLDEMLEKVAGFYDRWVEFTLKKITTLIEPILMLIMGCLIGFIMASMLLPMFDMIKVLRTSRGGI